MIVNLSKNTVLAKRAVVADRLFARLKGLLGKRCLDDQQDALVIKPAKSIHTFFMRFAIDAVFVDKKNKVVGLSENLKPFQITPVFWSSLSVIELPAATIQNTRTQIGDILKIEI